MSKPQVPKIYPGIEVLDDNESLASSIVESSVYASSELDEDIEALNSNSLKRQLEQITPLATYNNINVSNSTNVVIGNVIKIKGTLHINIYDENYRKKSQKEYIEPVHKNSDSPQNENLCTNSSACFIIPRSCWFALEPLDEYKYIHETVDIVVICHTGTEVSTSAARNMEILRNIQTFHIDSQQWGDIGYNFLIGCDGNVYEGRGFRVVGAHTLGYNSRSIGIGLIGSFSCSLPTKKALQSCKKLLKRGTDEGYLANDYKLLAHRQCINTISPGRLLYEEISKWDQFFNKDVHDII